MFQKISGSEKVYGSEGWGGLSKLFVELLVAKKFMENKGEGGVSIFSVKNFLSQIAEKFRRGTFSLSFFRVSKKFMLQRVLSRFSIDFFCLTVLEHFVEEPFCAVFQIISDCKKIMEKKWGRGII